MDLEFLKKHKTFYMAVAFESLAGTTAIILSLLFKYDLFRNIKISFEGLTHGFLYTIPVAMFFFIVFKIPLRHLKKIEHIITNFVNVFLGNFGFLQFLILSGIAGACEELLFRGFLQGYIADKFGLLAGIIIANIAFGLMHPISFLYSFITFLAGCYFSAVLYFTNNLFVLMTTHALYDFLALCYIKLRKNK